MDLLSENDVPGAYPDSYYHATAHAEPDLPELEQNEQCDVCIIGGGYTGLSAALHLAQSGLDVILLEANRVGWGASGRNGGQLGSGQRVDQDQLETMFGVEKAQALWRLGEESKALVHKLIADHKIECGYHSGIMYVDHRQRFVESSRAYAEKLQNDYGYEQIRFIDKSELSKIMQTDAYHGGVLDSGAGHLHPLNFALGLARAAKSAGARIFENSRVTAVENGPKPAIMTEKAMVKANHLVYACNGYIGELEEAVSARVLPINNYIIATEPMDAALAQSLIANNAAVADSRNVINYFRLSPDNRLLFGGGETYGYRFPSDIKSYVRRYMLRVYPQLEDVRIDYGWGGTLGITFNRLPHITQVEPNIMSASGYSGHGIGMATLCGKLLAEAINGSTRRFDLMESIPNAAFPGGTGLRQPLLVLAMLYYSLRDKI
ncbi:FAD-binding oxidoreductase [Hoeflea sp. CAU 1731]